MSSSYSSLDCALSHWAHLTVHRFICVCVYFVCFFLSAAYALYHCNMVRWTWWNWSLILSTLSSFSALTLLVGSFDPWKAIPDMTYNVFGGTLNLNPSTITVHTGNTWEFGQDRAGFLQLSSTSSNNTILTSSEHGCVHVTIQYGVSSWRRLYSLKACHPLMMMSYFTNVTCHIELFTRPVQGEHRLASCHFYFTLPFVSNLCIVSQQTRILCIFIRYLVAENTCCVSRIFVITGT